MNDLFYIELMQKLLKSFENIIKIFYEHQALYIADPTAENEEVFVIMRDAMIQRFKYCTNLIWKIFNDYLKQVEKVDIESSSPRGMVREAVYVGLLSEVEGYACMRMIESRDRTSHSYYLEIAKDLAQAVPEYYLLMKKIIDRIQAGIAKK